MKKGILIFFAGCYLSVCGHAQNLHHEINAEVNIATQTIEVVDELKIPLTYLQAHDTVSFYLNSRFSVKSESPAFVLTEIKMDAEDSLRKKYMIHSKKKIKSDQVVKLVFGGKVADEVEDGVSASVRGFSTTDGIISEVGVYLAGSTTWIPTFTGELFSYNLEVEIDKGWGIVSQGTRTLNVEQDGKQVVRYESPELMDEIYLIAAQFNEYSKQTDHVLVQAFLRTPDEEMANKYIETTIEYLEMYENLLGRYPFTKFALVENFWETGYGMPSFTLLGEKVIRLPFILHSSYPHELLHNWWGNSVYVNYDKGNWCEGVTVYMADHLIKEKIGQGSKYRRETLEKYITHVNNGNEIAVSQFLSRNNPAEEAVGYGKVMMINEMLRYKLGDSIFIKAYAKFYADYKFKYASFDDIQKTFEEVSGENLQEFFDQWILRKGAPAIELDSVTVTGNGPYVLSVSLAQNQPEDVFKLDVPVAVYLEGDAEVTFERIEMGERAQTYTFTYDKRPLKVEIDPLVNVFRRLDVNEIPPILSQLFGSQESIMILPSKSPFIDAYKTLAEEWKAVQEGQDKKFTILYDQDLDKLPASPTWIVGYENKFAKNYLAEYYSEYLTEETLAKLTENFVSGSVVYSFLNASNNNQITGFLGTTIEKSIPALTTKLSHYGKYSYLGFAGEEATNNLKGELPALNSPMMKFLEYDGEKPVITAKLKERKLLENKME